MVPFLYFSKECLVLHGAIHNDADFLSSHSIIDYSLLVGVDEESDKLYIGIIDFIRTYTWDKVFLLISRYERSMNWLIGKVVEVDLRAPRISVGLNFNP